VVEWEVLTVPVKLAESGGETVLAVYVTPRAGRTEIAGERSGALWLRLAAPPVQGAANEALVAFLARRLGLPKAGVAIVAGAAGRQKRVRIALPAALVRLRLGL
jgi:uncharacterized protein (TIGR00251 family)